MKYIKYFLFFIPHLIVTLLCWLTNPIACLFPVRQANGRDKLGGIFDLWSTFDNPVDEGYYGKYWTTPTNYQSSKLTRYIYRLKWLSRNTGYGWTYLLFAIPRGTGFQWKGAVPLTEPRHALISLVFFTLIAWLLFPILWAIGAGICITLYLVAAGFHNDYNIGWKDHSGIERLSYAARVIGLRKIK